MNYNFTKIIKTKLLIILLTAGFNFQLLAQEKAPKLSISAAIGIPATMFSVNSKFIGIYTGAARYSFNKSWSFETRVTAHTFFNNATGNARKASLDGTASDVLTYRTPNYGLNGIFYYNLHKIFGLDRKPNSRFLPFVNFGAGLYWYKPSVSFVNGIDNNSISFTKPYRDYQLGIGTRYYLNYLIDLYGGAEYHHVESYYLDGIKETSNPNLDTYLNFYAGLSIKLGAKKHVNLLDWSHKNVVEEVQDAKDYGSWALDGTVGLPILFSPVGYNLTGMFGLGLRKSFNNFLSGQLNFTYGKVSGDQATVGTPRNGTPEYVRSFSTSLSQITGRVLVNIRNLAAEPNNKRIWNHYAIIGAGYTKATGDATFANGKSISNGALSTSPGIQTIIVGYTARKYINRQFDLIAGVDFNYNGSKWIDQVYANTSLDNHLYFHSGVTYKLGTSKNREHIDWSYANYSNFKNKKTVLTQVPVIEKPAAVEPKIETMPIIVEPTPVVEPTPAPAVALTPVPTPTPEPAIKATPTPSPATKPTLITKPAPITTPIASPVAKTKPVKDVAQSPVNEPVNKAPKIAEVYELNNEVIPPSFKYNVVVGCYSSNKLAVAQNTQKILVNKGFNPSISRSSSNSRILRLSLISTDNRVEAIKTLRKARKEVEPGSWLYIYNAQ